tara:strand:+ start:968 stop:2893 length:1926 start_codon:yes stop_codon:yes gene_type:complete
MPIRFEHGPNLAPIGKLAYQTGQLEYRNKRRTELERIAMQQAEMRQRAQQQQQEIAARLQGQQMSHMGAMQQLQLRQHFGQINAEQANQQAAKVAIQDQENKMIWGKQLGQNQLDLANLGAGLADAKVIKNLQWKQKWDGIKRRINGQGQAAILKNEADRRRELSSPKNNPAEHGNINAQFDKINEDIESDPNNLINVEDQLGYTKPVSRNDKGEVTINQVNIGSNPDTGQQMLEYVIQTYRNVEVPDGQGGFTNERVDRTPAEINAIRHIPITIGNKVYVGTHNSQTNGYDIDLNRGEDTPKVKAQQLHADKMERFDDDMKDWRSDQIKHRANWTAELRVFELTDDTGDDFKSFEQWLLDTGAPTAPVAPVEPDWTQFDGAPGPAGQVGPAGMGGQQNIEDELSLGDKGRPMAQGTQGVTGAPGAQGMAGEPNAPRSFVEPEFSLQQESDFADLQPEIPQAPQAPPSEEFKTVPPKYHPKKQYSRTYKYDAPEKYDMMNMPINAIDPVDRQAVYEQRQRISKVLPWDSATNGPVGFNSLINIVKQPDSYGLKIDLSRDTSEAGKLMADAWQEETGSTTINVTEDLMWKLLSPGLSKEESDQLLDRIYTEKKKHFEFYGEAEHFQNNRMNSFMQRVTEELR